MDCIWDVSLVSGNDIQGTKRTQILLKKSRVVIPVFGAVIRGHVWTVYRTLV